MIRTETVPVVGKLFTKFGTFNMLKLFPNMYDVPSLLRDKFLSFYVVDSDGFAKNIYVNSGEVIIKPLIKMEHLSVNFWIEDENIKVESSVSPDA